MAPLAPSFWNSNSAFQIPVSNRLVLPRSASVWPARQKLFEEVEERFEVDELRVYFW